MKVIGKLLTRLNMFKEFNKRTQKIPRDSRALYYLLTHTYTQANHFALTL